jgi:DnaK suppressor protein
MKAVLLRRRDALRSSLAGELTSFQTSDNPVVGDFVDLALDGEYARVNSELAETESHELDQIERALERLREGRYGTCEACNAKIPVARLQAIPHATMCVQCRALSERGMNDWSRTERNFNSSGYPMHRSIGALVQ